MNNIIETNKVTKTMVQINTLIIEFQKTRTQVKLREALKDYFGTNRGRATLHSREIAEKQSL